MKTKWLLLCTLGVSLNMIFSYAQNTEIMTHSLLKIANDDLEKWVSLIKKDNIQNYGFNSNDELNKIELGMPIQTLLLSPSFYEDSLLSDNNYFIESEEYRIPIIVNGTIRSFLILNNENNQWLVVGVGENILASNLMNCIQINQIEIENVIVFLHEPLSRSVYLITDFYNREADASFFLLRRIAEKGMKKDEILTLIHQKIKAWEK